VNGEAALAVALNASVGKFAHMSAQNSATTTPAPRPTPTPTPAPTQAQAVAPRAERGTKGKKKVARGVKSRRVPKRQRVPRKGR
jgi:hypothetical protein